jgi:hypothetical protein
VNLPTSLSLCLEGLNSVEEYGYKQITDPTMTRHAVESQDNYMSQYRPVDGRTMRRAIKWRRHIEAKKAGKNS